MGNEPNDTEAIIYSRRGFCKKMGWGSFILVNMIYGICGLRFFYPRVVREGNSVFKAGYPQEFAMDVVNTNFVKNYRVWIVREKGGFYALRSVCTHLGCIPEWLASENKFKCPCHGSGFTREGLHYEGPAPRALERVKITLADDGQLWIDSSISFREDRGEWENPEAYLYYI